MAVVVIRCESASWAKDFSPHVDRARIYFTRCFRNERDREEAIQEAMCQLCEMIAQKHRVGAELHVNLVWAALRVKRGSTFAGRRKGGCARLERRMIRVPLLPDEVGTGRTHFAAYLRSDAWLDMEPLTPLERCALRMMAAGCNRHEIYARAGFNRNRAWRLIRSLRERLTAVD